MLRRTFLAVLGSLPIADAAFGTRSAAPAPVYGSWMVCRPEDADFVFPMVHSNAKLTAQALGRPLRYRIITRHNSNDPLEQGPQSGAPYPYTIGWRTCAWYERGARLAPMNM